MKEFFEQAKFWFERAKAWVAEVGRNRRVMGPIKAVLKWFGIVVGVLVLTLALVLFGARFMDGPRGLLAGGAFRSGEPAPAPVDWTFLEDRELMDFQTVNPPRSRTVWLAVHQRRLYLVSGYMQTGFGRLWKQWPHGIEEDDRIILRVDGRLYEQRLERIHGGAVVPAVLSEYNRKYGTGEVSDDSAVTSGAVWMYEVVDR